MEHIGEREHGVRDITMLLAVVFLALVTWVYLQDADGALARKLYTGVAMTWLLALAALTRHRRRSALIGFVAGCWLIAAPHLLAFSHVAPAHGAYVTTGLIVAAMSIPGLAGPRTPNVRFAV